MIETAEIPSLCSAITLKGNKKHDRMINVGVSCRLEVGVDETE